MRSTVHVSSASRKPSHTKRSGYPSKSQSKVDLDAPFEDKGEIPETSLQDESMQEPESRIQELGESPLTRLAKKATLESKRESGFKKSLGKMMPHMSQRYFDRFDSVRTSSPKKYKRGQTDGSKIKSDAARNYVVIKSRFEIKQAKSNTSRTFSINKHKRKQPKTTSKNIQDWIAKTDLFNKIYATADGESSLPLTIQNKEVHFPMEAELASLDSIKEKPGYSKESKNAFDKKDVVGNLKKQHELNFKTTPELRAYITRRFKPVPAHYPSFDDCQADFKNHWHQLKSKTITRLLLHGHD